jgi:hypothetical protein
LFNTVSNKMTVLPFSSSLLMTIRPITPIPR